MNAILNNDCMEELKNFPDNIIDSVVTDPPYGLSDLSPEKITTTMMEWASGNHSFIPKGRGFMNKDWDSFVPPPAVWKEVLRVLKPGGHILCFAGSRTVDLMTISLRIAGFEIRDTLMWMYGSGFPKSMNVGKAIDKHTGDAPESPNKGKWRPGPQGSAPTHQEGWGTTEVFDWDLVNEEAQKWAGWGTALKPAVEPIILARKPLDGNVANNVLKWGVGGINVDGCRVGSELLPEKKSGVSSLMGGLKNKISDINGITPERSGRWPANVILDEDAAVMLDKQTGQLSMRFSESSGSEGFFGGGKAFKSYDDGDNMGASRFFYVAKTSKKEREAGLDGMEVRQTGAMQGNITGGRLGGDGSEIKPIHRANHHPTVKPVKLMTYLCRLITPPGGTVLDPFTGSGSTGIAAVLEGFTFIGIEQNAEYAEIARKRIDYHLTSK